MTDAWTISDPAPPPPEPPRVPYREHKTNGDLRHDFAAFMLALWYESGQKPPTFRKALQAATEHFMLEH